MKPGEENPAPDHDRRLPTPEELRWQASAYDPAKARRMLKYLYILLAVWFALLIGWISYLLWGSGSTTGDRWQLIALLLSGFTVLLSIVNNRRIIKGKKPWGDF